MNIPMFIGELLVIIGICFYTTGLSAYFRAERFISVDKNIRVKLGRIIFKDANGAIIKPRLDDGTEVEPFNILIAEEIKKEEKT